MCFHTYKNIKLLFFYFHNLLFKALNVLLNLIVQEQLEELILNKYQPEECLMQLVNKFASRMKVSYKSLFSRLYMLINIK